VTSKLGIALLGPFLATPLAVAVADSAMPTALVAAQMISKEADPQVRLAIVLNPGTQQCGSLNFPSNLPS